MKNKKIKVGFLVSYDYEFLKTSIPLVYHSADEIYLAIDINNNTWSGNKFQIHDSFFDWINKIDKNQKIKIYKDDFYDITLSSKENDTREKISYETHGFRWMAYSNRC